MGHLKVVTGENPDLSWLTFYYCWGLHRKFWINYKAKILKSCYQRWTWTFWDCFELLPSQQKGSFPTWRAWKDSPSAASPSSCPTKALWLPWYLHLKPAFVYLHLPPIGEDLLPLLFELVPICTDCPHKLLPSLETTPDLHHTQPLNKRISPEDAGKPLPMRCDKKREISSLSLLRKIQSKITSPNF